MTAKEQAVKDIKNDLKKNGKSFLSFRTELNPVMDSIVNQYSKAQEKIAWCLSGWTLPSIRKSGRRAVRGKLVASCFFNVSTGKAKYKNYGK